MSKKEELSVLDKGLRKLIEQKMSTLPKTEATFIQKELKSLQNAFQINTLGTAYESTGTPEIFF